eukprot:PITA_04430
MELRKDFEMTHLGYVHYYLGIEVTQHPKLIFLSQKKYIGDLLNRLGMVECNPLTTPLEQNLKLTSTKGKEFEDATKFMQKPCEGHWSTAKRVLKYFKGTQDFGLKYTQVGNFNLIGYSDSNFDGYEETRLSTLGYVMRLESRVVSWRSCKQSVPTDSTTKAKYVAAEATKEIVWLEKF